MEVADQIICKILIKELPEMRVATYRVISQKPERDSNYYLRKIIEANGLDFNVLPKYGIDVPISSRKLYKGLRGYECWVCIPDHIDVLEGTQIKTIPKNKYAVLRINVSVKSPIESISKGWLELQDWIFMNGYSTALNNPNRYMLEKQIEIGGISYLELYFPL